MRRDVFLAVRPSQDPSGRNEAVKNNFRDFLGSHHVQWRIVQRFPDAAPCFVDNVKYLIRVYERPEGRWHDTIGLTKRQLEPFENEGTR